MSNPICELCRKEMTPENSRICPEAFVCDECARKDATVRMVYGERIRELDKQSDLLITTLDDASLEDLETWLHLHERGQSDVRPVLAVRRVVKSLRAALEREVTLRDRIEELESALRHAVTFAVDHTDRDWYREVLGRGKAPTTEEEQAGND